MTTGKSPKPWWVLFGDADYLLSFMKTHMTYQTMWRHLAGRPVEWFQIGTSFSTNVLTGDWRFLFETNAMRHGICSSVPLFVCSVSGNAHSVRITWFHPTGVHNLSSDFASCGLSRNMIKTPHDTFSGSSVYATFYFFGLICYFIWCFSDKI